MTLYQYKSTTITVLYTLLISLKQNTPWKEVS